MWPFKIFKGKSRNRISFSAEDRRWVDENFIWFGELFGFEKVGITYHIDTFYANGKEFEFSYVFQTICNVYEVNADDIIVRVFDDEEKQIWYTISGTHQEVMGEYYESFEETKKRFNIKLAKSLFRDHEHLVAVLAHELSHVKLLGEKYVESDNPDMEPLTDLFVIFSGFGPFAANTSLQYSNRSIHKTGYLSNECIAYAMALRSKISKETGGKWVTYLRDNTKSLYQAYLKYLLETGDTVLEEKKINEVSAKYLWIKKAKRGIDEKDYPTVIDANNQLLEIDQKDVGAWNQRGYGNLMLGHFERALKDFTSGIELDPFWDLLYANRGLCYINLNKLSNAYTDLDSALQMNPDNSWTNRNMGVYYLKKQNLTRAEFYLQRTIEIDPSEDLVHYYLGELFLQKGEIEKAKASFQLSADNREKEGTDALAKLKE